MLWELGMGKGRVIWCLVQGSWGGFREEGHLTLALKDLKELGQNEQRQGRKYRKVRSHQRGHMLQYLP